MGIFRRIKEKVNSWLESMAKSNEEQFGNNEPDCCKMNQVTQKDEVPKQRK